MMGWLSAGDGAFDSARFELCVRRAGFLQLNRTRIMTEVPSNDRSPAPPGRPDHGAVSSLVDTTAGGERTAADELLPLVYDELRNLAAARLAHEPSGQTLQATALVHEAYLRLVGHEPRRAFDNRALFLRGRGRGDAPDPGRPGP